MLLGGTVGAFKWRDRNTIAHFLRRYASEKSDGSVGFILVNSKRARGVLFARGQPTTRGGPMRVRRVFISAGLALLALTSGAARSWAADSSKSHSQRDEPAEQPRPDFLFGQPRSWIGL